MFRHLRVPILAAATTLFVLSEAFAQAAPPPTTAVPAPAPPFRASDALGTPSWFRFGLEHRIRFEHLQHDFRSAARGDPSALSLRTLLSGELRFLPLVLGAELMDARAYASADTPLNTTLVDPLEILQAYVSLQEEGLIQSGDTARLTLGRMTLDLGSRRLLARNEFRNTINSFTGLDLQWTSPRRHVVRTFLVFPVMRLDSDPEALSENRVALDRENRDALFAGVFFGSGPLGPALQAEAYVLGLREADNPDAPSLNRKLITAGLRILRAPKPGQLDTQAEGMVQAGSSRATTAATDTTRLAHLAFSGHATLGYQFEMPWAPRIALQYDYASGDRKPSDHKQGRFDPLFGARRFELGPTGLYGALARSNLSSPAVRVELWPEAHVDAFAAYRMVWLASARDAWTTAGQRDPSGESGRFVGQQVEGRLRLHVFPKNLTLDVGGAYLARGRFATDAPLGRKADPIYVYTQLTGTI